MTAAANSASGPIRRMDAVVRVLARSLQFVLLHSVVERFVAKGETLWAVVAEARF
jgi:hypothetical protein